MSSTYDNEGSFCSDYLVVNPEKASLSDLVRLLVSHELIASKDFLERPPGLAAADEHLKRLRYRWVVFISIMAQKIFLLLKKPVAGFGYWVQVWLNLVSNNRGLLKLFFNMITGNVVRPMESWDTFRSVVGNLDVRVDLDERIDANEDGDERYLVHLSLMAAKLSYENSAFVENVVTNHWQMELLQFYNFWNAFQGKYTTQAFVCRKSAADPNLVVISFRGTEPFDTDGWCTDVDISWYGMKGVGKVHGGFMKALGLPRNLDWPKEINTAQEEGPSAYYTVRQIMRERTRNSENAEFIVTGHSLGGALAILFVGLLMVHEEEEVLRKIRGVYTFGQPRVGDAEFGEFMKEKLKAYHVTYRRFVYCNDAVPRLPYDDKSLLFKHFGPCLFYDSLYNGKILPEEPNKNYFSLLWVLPKYVNAYWELIRGVTFLPMQRGREYGEGWSLRVYRMIGLLIPGLSAHGPQDYDNITRLGSMMPTSNTHLQTLQRENGSKLD